MKNLHSKWWLVAVASLCLVSSAFAVKPNRDRDRGCGFRAKNCQQVPEGGSGLVYLLGAGIACAGAMVVSSRAKSNAA